MEKLQGHDSYNQAVESRCGRQVQTDREKIWKGLDLRARKDKIFKPHFQTKGLRGRERKGRGREEREGNREWEGRRGEGKGGEGEVSEGKGRECKGREGQ